MGFLAFFPSQDSPGVFPSFFKSKEKRNLLLHIVQKKIALDTYSLVYTVNAVSIYEELHRDSTYIINHINIDVLDSVTSDVFVEYTENVNFFTLLSEFRKIHVVRRMRDLFTKQKVGLAAFYTRVIRISKDEIWTKIDRIDRQWLSDRSILPTN